MSSVLMDHDLELMNMLLYEAKGIFEGGLKAANHLDLKMGTLSG